MSSVRAYRVLDIDLALPSSFDLFDDKKLVEFFRDKCKLLVVLDHKGVGVFHIPTVLVEKAISEAGMNLETKAALSRDVEFAKERGIDEIQYLFIGE